MCEACDELHTELDKLEKQLAEARADAFLLGREVAKAFVALHRLAWAADPAVRHAVMPVYQKLKRRLEGFIHE